MTLPLVVAITGATGVIYGVELLRVLKALGQPTHLILSESAGLNLSIETDVSLEEVRSLASVVYSNKDVGAAVAKRVVGVPGRINRDHLVALLQRADNRIHGLAVIPFGLRFAAVTWRVLPLLRRAPLQIESQSNSHPPSLFCPFV